jgi:asparagine synthase (glutamine-hydrolysing)
MSDLLAHRGPDGAGMWVDPRGGRTVGLVHRRLAIIDLACGRQPMGNEDGTVQVVFNGEIYNYAELRAELASKGHRFATDHSDTEVLVHGWEEWGVELPAKLRGMFAFAVWDQRSETLFLARDRMGQKPLFYATLEDGIVFGSTIPSVLAWPEVPRRVPREQLALYLRLGYVPPPQTIWRDISQVVPGAWIRLRNDLLDGARYWKCATDTFPAHLTEAEAGQQIRSTLERAVASQLVADVPIACFLSGGIDSSIIAALMQKEALSSGAPPIQTVSVGFAESGFDETSYAAAVAKKIGSRHVRLEVNARQDLMHTLQMLMRISLGQPFGDSSIIPTYQLSKAVRQIAPVTLSGDGADELFGGYDRYRGMQWLARWGWLMRFMPIPRPWTGRELRLHERARRLFAAAHARDVSQRYTRLVDIFWREHIEQLLGEKVDDIAPTLEELEIDNVSSLRLGMLRDQLEYLPGDVLWKVDSASMAEGLEVRSPFLDHDVVGLANRLDDGLLVRGGVGKWILRNEFREELPTEVFRRGKMGFAVPIGEWFKGELRGMLEEYLTGSGSFVREQLQVAAVEKLLHEHMHKERDHSLRLFTLLMLELWAREFRPVVEG